MELISVFNQSVSTRIINIRLNQTVFLDPKHSKHKPFGQIFPINILKETQRKQTQNFVESFTSYTNEKNT